jgi:hypothetical protein
VNETERAPRKNLWPRTDAEAEGRAGSCARCRGSSAARRRRDHDSDPEWPVGCALARKHRASRRDCCARVASPAASPSDGSIDDGNAKLAGP